MTDNIQPFRGFRCNDVNVRVGRDRRRQILQFAVDFDGQSRFGQPRTDFRGNFGAAGLSVK